jgi:NAD(P)-dependent dehydrogenase (short-subunit alcohol dehydrogenase family)
MTTKIALITGGNRGLGRATALALAGAGTDVILTYRSNADEAAAVVDEITARGRRAVALRLDTTDVAFDGFVDAVRAALKETSSPEIPRSGTVTRSASPTARRSGCGIRSWV